MKTFLILSVLLAAAHAGVRELSPQEEQEALDLFNRICSSGAEGQNLGDTLVYCKRARGDVQQTLDHQVQVNSGGGGPGQVVFVQPPPVKYTHRVAISGSAAQGQQAKIYVLPQRATHELQAQYQGGGTQAQKPQVYFLRGETGGNGGGGGGGYQSGGGNNNGTGGGSGGYQQGGSNGTGGGGYQQGGSGGGGYQQQQQSFYVQPSRNNSPPSSGGYTK